MQSHVSVNVSCHTPMNVAIPFPSYSVRWCQRVLQWLQSIITCMVLLRWPVYHPRDQSHIGWIAKILRLSLIYFHMKLANCSNSAYCSGHSQLSCTWPFCVRLLIQGIKVQFRLVCVNTVHNHWHAISIASSSPTAQIPARSNDILIN